MDLLILLAIVILFILLLQREEYRPTTTIAGIHNGLDPNVYWRTSYSPELRIWAAVGIPSIQYPYGVSAYSYDGIKWTTVSPQDQGLPIQWTAYLPAVNYNSQDTWINSNMYHLQMVCHGWKNVCAGLIDTGYPGFVAVTGDFNQSNCQDNQNYHSIAVSHDGITWKVLPDQFPSRVCWTSITYQPATNEFVIIGDTDPQCGVGSFKSKDGYNWVAVSGIPHDYNEIQSMVAGPDKIVAYGEPFSFSLSPEPGPTMGTPFILDSTSPSSSWIGYLDTPTGNNENITQLIYDEFSTTYYGIGYHNVYGSSDGINWVPVNTNGISGTSIFQNNLTPYNTSSPLSGGYLYGFFSGTNLRNSILKLNDTYIIHMSYGKGMPTGNVSNYNFYMYGFDTLQQISGQFYYSNTGINGPWLLGSTNVTDDMILDLYTDGKIAIGLGWSQSGNLTVAFSIDGMNWQLI